MYCPSCLNDSLYLASKGVVNVIVNGKQMDAGRFLFNLEEDKRSQVEKDFARKLEEFFSWYSSFKNKDPIQYIELISTDFVCETQGCSFSKTASRLSVVDVLISMADIVEYLHHLGKKYNMEIELKD